MKNSPLYLYRLYGWTIGSDIRLEGLPETTGEPEIFVRLNPPEKQEGSTHFYCPIRGKGYFRISENEITIHPSGEISALVPYLLGCAFGILIHQRNMPVIHGSAIAIDHAAFIFSAPSGGGKSTLASAFLRQGYQLLSDDVCVLSVNGNHTMVHPSYPQLKQWINEKTDASSPASETKVALPVISGFVSTPLPLKHLYVLCRQPATFPDVFIEEISGSRKFDLLAQQVYCLPLVRMFGHEKEYFRHMLHLAKTIKVFNLFYPGKLSFLEKVIHQVIQNAAYE